MIGGIKEDSGKDLLGLRINKLVNFMLQINYYANNMIYSLILLSKQTSYGTVEKSVPALKRTRKTKQITCLIKRNKYIQINKQCNQK